MAKKDVDDKNAIIEKVVKNITTTFGSGSALILGRSSKAAGVNCISTGVESIDRAIYGKGGGIPVGMLTEISGWESTGKTLLAKCIIASTQKSGGIGIFIDSEAAFQVPVANAVGININDLIYCQPNTMEEVFDMIDKIVEEIRGDKFSNNITIVWDSIASTPTKSEFEGEKAGMAERARLIGERLRRMTMTISKMKVSVVFINQLREKVGIVYGNPEFTPGGNAIPFYSAVRLRMKKGAVIYDGNNAIGEWFSLNAIKNKIAPPFKTSKFEVYFDKGIPKYSGMVDYLVDKGLLKDRALGSEKASGWYWLASDESVDPKTKEILVAHKFRYADFDKIILAHPELLD